jgi:lipopolysaccharide export system protein LptA
MMHVLTARRRTDRHLAPPKASSAAGAAAVVAALMAISVVTVHAQQPAPPNALQGFSQNRNKPIKINAASLEVRDKDKVATFAGDVHLVQGDVSLRSKTLVVFYDDQAGALASSKNSKGAPAAAQITPQQQNQQIKRVEAKGGVTVTQKDQTASGDQGIFDMRANTVTMAGNVVISQGPSIVKGDTLTVNMNTGSSTISCRTPGQCRVQALIVPGAIKQELPAPGGDRRRTP